MSTEAKEHKQRELKKKSKYSTRVYNRCKLCGRSRAYMRQFDMCRICFRKLAHEGKIPGVVKSSW
ncbi:MAG TPA: type Z 30S ribosomal protein S14 [bacterium]|nr:type Z 30S ribosomal protein S14 [bacterium]